MTNAVKPPTWFWVVSIITLIWNLLGVMAYIAQVTMTPEALQALPEDQRSLYENVPSWVTSAFAIAVWGSTLGCILLIIKKKLATLVLIGSFIAIVIQLYYNVAMSKAVDVYGPGGMVMPVMVFLIGAFLIWFSRMSANKGWIS